MRTSQLNIFRTVVHLAVSPPPLRSFICLYPYFFVIISFGSCSVVISGSHSWVICYRRYYSQSRTPLARTCANSLAYARMHSPSVSSHTGPPFRPRSRTHTSHTRVCAYFHEPRRRERLHIAARAGERAIVIGLAGNTRMPRYQFELFFSMNTVAEFYYYSSEDLSGRFCQSFSTCDRISTPPPLSPQSCFDISFSYPYSIQFLLSLALPINGNWSAPRLKREKNRGETRISGGVYFFCVVFTRPFNVVFRRWQTKIRPRCEMAFSSVTFQSPSFFGFFCFVLFLFHRFF